MLKEAMIEAIDTVGMYAEMGERWCTVRRTYAHETEGAYVLICDWLGTSDRPNEIESYHHDTDALLWAMAREIPLGYWTEMDWGD